LPDEETNYDDVPPRCIFASDDRNPLKLRTHKACNSAHQLTDEKFGQLIALRRREIPRPERQRLKIVRSADNYALVTNLDIDGAMWRWIRGFHAALYREPFSGERRRTIVTPFTRATIDGNEAVPIQIRPQHLVFVETIKNNRARDNLDQVRCNNDKLVYECVWSKADDGRWICIFAMDVYDWKDLGAISRFPIRGCAGCYMMEDEAKPLIGTSEVRSKILVPNLDPLDAFGR
jgi:hypothetical protein